MVWISLKQAWLISRDQGNPSLVVLLLVLTFLKAYAIFVSCSFYMLLCGIMLFLHATVSSCFFLSMLNMIQSEYPC